MVCPLSERGRSGHDDPMPDDVPPTGTGPTLRRLRRSTDDRDLAGVLGGLGEALGVESHWLRLAVVAATGFLAFGVGAGAQLLVVLPYAAAWALLPTDAARPLLLQVPRRAALQELGLVALLVVVTTVVALQPGLALVAALGGVAALLLRDRPADPGPEPGAPTEAPGPAEPVEAGAVPARSAGRNRPVPRPRREPALWPLAAGLAAVVVVVVVAGLVAGWVIDVRVVVNLLLLVVGGVMALSAWRGRARVLLLACPALLLVWFATSAADIGGHDGFGRRRERPTATGADGTLSYELGYGRMDVDLTGLELRSGSRTEVEVGLSMGSVRVTVPTDARVEVTGEVGLGVVGVPVDRWGRDTQLAAHRDLRLDSEPVGPYCEPSQVAATELRLLAGAAGLGPVSPFAVEDDPATAGPADTAGDEQPVVHRRADDALLDLVEGGGFPRPRVLDRTEWYDERGRLVVEDLVETYMSDSAELCSPQAPDPDPAVVVIDATVGLGTVEVHRV